ncbi:MAG: ATP-binding protein [Myxococcales bacterium]|nr:ATP-binding protein [Myxococcales bacterium]MDD9965304.1 ATP-binding protein [Myxococcales bacterium]
MAAESIVGRAAEQERLRQVLNSREAELVALYGRRRVGKTFLVREVFSGHTYFEVTGEKDQAARVQIDRFVRELSRVFYEGRPLSPCASWGEAFELLAAAVEDFAERKPRSPIIVFLDELPWLATHRSRLMQALDHAWNARLSKVRTLRMIVCGSAAAWMLDKLVFAKGGLYNRITQRIALRPFTLAETADFLRSRAVKLPRQQVALLYMAIGGVPHYLKQVRRGRSVTQIIGELCFGRDGMLRDEFDTLFQSLFSSSQAHLAIVRALAANASGLSQDELATHTGVSSGGRFKQYLRELEASGFVAAFSPFGRRKKETLYRLMDEYSGFYLAWIDGAPSTALRGDGVRYWHAKSRSPAVSAWAGYAFERLCFKHVDCIIERLGLTSVGVTASSWRYLPSRRVAGTAGPARGAQIDLLLDRDDDTITACEMKYTDMPFTIDRQYARALGEKLSVFETVTKTRKAVQLVLVTAAGLKPNHYSEDLLADTVSLDAFFAQEPG